MIKRFFLSERGILAAIVINSLIIFLLHFPQIRDNYPELYKTLDYLDHVFVVLFIIEVLVKLKTYGTRIYFKKRWYIFDFVIVVLSIPSLLTFVPLFAATNLSLLKILRLFRVVRLLRLVSFIPRMESILAGLGRALQASVFILLALVFLNFICALFTCHFYGELAPDYFGDPLISSYYIFQMFTVEGWNEIPNVIAKAANANATDPQVGTMIAGFARFYFIIIVLLGGIFGMSLANAIFVDEMTSDNNEALEEKVDKLIEKIDRLEKHLGSKNG